MTEMPTINVGLATSETDLVVELGAIGPTGPPGPAGANGSPARRVSSATTAATLTVDTSAYDMAVLTGQATALTVAAPTGAPVTGRELLLRFKDNGTARTIAWNAVFRAMGVALPITTVASKTRYVRAIYNATDVRWDVVAVYSEL